MSLCADALQPFMLRGLFSLSGRTTSTNLADIIIQTKTGFDFDFDAVEQSLSLDFREPSLIIGAFASDSTRLALASFQSIRPAISDMANKQTLAWSTVKLYYAAFYAGHAVIRLL